MSKKTYKQLKKTSHLLTFRNVRDVLKLTKDFIFIINMIGVFKPAVTSLISWFNNSQRLAHWPPEAVDALTDAMYDSLTITKNGNDRQILATKYLKILDKLPFGRFFPPETIDKQDIDNIFEDAIVGQDRMKRQIKRIIAERAIKRKIFGKSIGFCGPPGIGKTRFIRKGLARCFGTLDYNAQRYIARPVQFVSLAGMSNVNLLAGYNATDSLNGYGMLMQSLLKSGSMDPIIVFDEVDKISDGPGGADVISLLLRITDPEQNDKFRDNFLPRVPLDLSKCIFVFTLNDRNKVNRILADRIDIVDIDIPTREEKIQILDMMFGDAIKDTELKVTLSEGAKNKIIDLYSNEHQGMRQVKHFLNRLAGELFNCLHFNEKFNKKKIIEKSPITIYNADVNYMLSLDGRPSSAIATPPNKPTADGTGASTQNESS